MSMFGDGTAKERIYEELKYIYQERYKTKWEDPEYELKFTMDVLDVLNTMFGDW